MSLIFYYQLKVSLVINWMTCDVLDFIHVFFLNIHFQHKVKYMIYHRHAQVTTNIHISKFQ